MSGVNIEYKGESIATIPDTGSKTIKTQGKYCEGDILVEYVAPSFLPIKEKDVNFYDYDGTLLYSWTKAEALAASELPKHTSEHNTLIFTNWNWSLQSIQERLLRLDDPIIVGAIYDTIDGNTRLYIEIPHSGMVNVELFLQYYSEDEAMIDWGDGIIDDIEGGQRHSYTHTYSGTTYPAYYTITIINNSELDKVYLGYSGKSIFDDNAAKSSVLIKAEIGSKCQLNIDNAFYRCVRLKNVSLYEGSTLRGIYVFGATGLRFIALPQSATDSGYLGFWGCHDLYMISLSDRCTQIGSQCFGSSSLKRISLPLSIVNLTNYSLGDLHLDKLAIPNTIQTFPSNLHLYVRILDLSDYDDPESLPTLSSVDIFYFESPMIIFVRNQQMLETFINATNWSTHIDKFQIKGE